jgi:integrase
LAAPLLEVHADALTALDVKSWHNALAAERGRPTANKALGHLRSMFNRAMIWRRPDGRPYATSNPASATAVPRFVEHSRDRFLKPGELRPFLESVADHDLADCRHLIQLLLYTAARRAAVQAMRWRDIDFENGIWQIPREFMKGGRADHPVPLVRQALRVLILRKEFAGNNAWVFPGRRRGQHITTVEGWFGELRAASGILDIVPHDLRRTMASYMAMTGASVPIIAQMLGHKLPGVTSIYARLSVEPVRAAAQEATDYIMEVAGIDNA